MQKQPANINKGATKPAVSQTKVTPAAQVAPKQQTKAEQPKHNMTVIELSTPHQKLPGVQRYTAEDLRIMVERAKQFPSVHEGYYLSIINYDFQVDEWELETGNSQPHSDESKLAMRPKTAVSAAQRRQEQAKKSKETREEMTAKLEKERNPTFKRPVTAGGVSNKGKGNGNNNKEEKNEDEEEKKENILENKSECKSEDEGEEEDQNQENDNQNDGEDVVNTDEDNKEDEDKENQEDQENEEQKNKNLEQDEEDNQGIQAKKINKNIKNVKITQEVQTNKQTKKESNTEKEKPVIQTKIRVPVVISQKDKQRRVNYQEIVNDVDDDDNMTGNSFEKMSLHSSKAREKSNVKQPAKGPYKSDVANVRKRRNKNIFQG